MRPRPLALLVLILAARPGGQASAAESADPAAPKASELLHFTDRERSFHPDLDAQEVAASFPFTNTSASAVRIVSTTTSCGCTVATTAQQVYQPGESGTVAATFTIGDRVGLQRKAIHVVTDPPAPEPIDLTLRVELPAGPVIEPAICLWDIGEARTEKVITVTLPEGSPFHLKEVKAAVGQFIISSMISPDGRTAHIHITPAFTLEAMAMAIDVVATTGLNGRSRLFRAFAAVNALEHPHEIPSPRPK